MIEGKLNRRDALRLSCGALLGISGCVTGGSDDTPTDESPPFVSDITTNYPTFSGYEILSVSDTDPEGEPVPFSELSPESRIEVANAIARGNYIVDKSAYSQSERYDYETPIPYKGSTFSLGSGILEFFSEPEYGPRADPNWRGPIAFDGRIEDDALVVTATNELDVPLDIEHFGRPYFGVLTAVGESPALLPHDRYDDNPFIQTTGVVRSSESYEIDYQTETIPPEYSLRETYELPDSLPENPTVSLSLRTSDSDIEQFGEHHVVVVANLSISTESSESSDERESSTPE